MTKWVDALKHPAVLAVLAAGLAIVANTAASSAVQRGALALADRQDRREIALELMRSDSQEQAIKKLDTLETAGLAVDSGGELRRAIGNTKSIFVSVPVAVSCVKSADIPHAPPATVLTGNATNDVNALAATDLRLRAYGGILRALLVSCELPDK